jgi:hypothetical protein
MASPGGAWVTMPNHYVFQSSGNTVVQHSEDVETAGWRKRLAKGDIINNPFLVKQVFSYPYPPTTIYTETTNLHYGQPYGYKRTGTCIPFQDGSGYAPDFLGTVDLPGLLEFRASKLSEAMTTARANVSEVDMLALASAAEFGKTVDFVAETLRRVHRILKALRKFNTQALKKEITPKALAQRYLEFRYALRPMYYDVKNAVRALNANTAPVRRKYRGGSAGHLEHSDVVYDRAFFFESLCDVKRTITYDVSVKAGILCDVDVDALSTFGLNQSLETMWELLPLSFIFDWFINIGESLAALTPNADIRQRASWVTVKEHYTMTNEAFNIRTAASPTIWTNTRVCNASPFKAKHEEFLLVREVDPVTSTYLHSKLNVDVFKILDLCLILKQMLR